MHSRKAGTNLSFQLALRVEALLVGYIEDIRMLNFMVPPTRLGSMKRKHFLGFLCSATDLRGVKVIVPESIK